MRSGRAANLASITGTTGVVGLTSQRQYVHDHLMAALLSSVAIAMSCTGAWANSHSQSHGQSPSTHHAKGHTSANLHKQIHRSSGQRHEHHGSRNLKSGDKQFRWVKRHGRLVKIRVSSPPVVSPEKTSLHTHPTASVPMIESSEHQNQAKLYALYDQGLNARLTGDNHTAVSRLAEMSELIKDSHLNPTMKAMAQYEFGRAAELDDQPKVAITAYGRALEFSPRLAEASIRLSRLLMQAGQPALALMRAREAVQRNPNDAPSRMALSMVLDRNGFAADAKAERERCTQLTNGVGKVEEPTPPIENASEPQGESLKPNSGENIGAPVPESAVPLGDVLTPIPQNVP